MNQILPLIHKTNPTFTFAAFGAHPSARLLEYGKKKGVSIFGWVEDIRMAYTSGKVFLAPMFIGTGLQNKLLEAMALGIPCVTTPLAGLPLGATNKLNILLAENPSEFECQIKLLNDSSIKEPLVQNAKKHIVAFFDWQTVTKPITELMLRN